MCGATSGQVTLGNQQSTFFNNATNQAQQILGDSSSVFKDLMASFTPIVAAGPSQAGFSLPELSALQSGAITGVGQAYKNAKEAAGEAESAVGGGNQPLPSGANIGINTNVAVSAAQQQANELNQINLANYATGRQNWQEAVQGELSAPGVFNPAVAATGAATNAGAAAANTQAQIANENQSWIQSVTGALGGIAGAAMDGWAKGGFSTGGGDSGGGGSPDFYGGSGTYNPVSGGYNS